MSNWPDKPLIRVLDGEVNGDGVADELAYRVGDGAYALVSEEHMDQTIARDAPGDTVVKWEEAAGVPVAELEALRSRLREFPLPERILSAAMAVTSHIPDPKPSPLDRAVARVEKMLDGRVTPPYTSPETYLSRLLGALAAYHDVEYSDDAVFRQQAARTLVTVVQLCVGWVADISLVGSKLSSTGRVLEEVRARVESAPTVGGFPAMAALAGTAAEWIDEAGETGEGRGRLAVGLPEPLLTLAHYALARAAKRIEGGE